MIGIKDQCFGVEIELTGITRAEAAEALAAYFETTPQRSYPADTAAGYQEQAEIHCGAEADTGNARAGKPTAGSERNDSRQRKIMSTSIDE